jgi:ribose transport system permease protein
VLAGLLFGLAAFLYVANNGSVDPATSGKNYELYAIAGVVIGGISMSGGRGLMLGVVFGSMSFTMIDKIINALGINPLINDSIKGIILLLAIAVQLLPRMMSKRGAKSA